MGILRAVAIGLLMLGALFAVPAHADVAPRWNSCSVRHQMIAGEISIERHFIVGGASYDKMEFQIPRFSAAASAPAIGAFWSYAGGPNPIAAGVVVWVQGASGNAYRIRLTGRHGQVDYALTGNQPYPNLSFFSVPQAEFDARFGDDAHITETLLRRTEGEADEVVATTRLDVAEYRARLATTKRLVAFLDARMAEQGKPCLNRTMPGEDVGYMSRCERKWTTELGSFGASMTGVGWSLKLDKDVTLTTFRGRSQTAWADVDLPIAAWRDRPRLDFTAVSWAKIDTMGLRIGNATILADKAQYASEAWPQWALEWPLWSAAAEPYAEVSVVGYRTGQPVYRHDLPKGLFQAVEREMAAGYAKLIDDARAPDKNCTFTRGEADSRIPPPVE